MALEPIPSTSTRLNSCLRSNQEQSSGRKSLVQRKRVKFTAEAMAKAKKHARGKSKYRSNQHTPPPRKSEYKMIGSSCTWTKEELDRFNVVVTHGVDAKVMIPAKFFMFDELKEYQKRRAEVDAVLEEDLANNEVIDRIENTSHGFFQPLMDLLSVQPDIRGINLSQKRRMPQSQPIGGQSSIQPSQSSQRIVSAGSIADPNQDSAGGVRVLASKEKTSDTFANRFLSYTISRVWPGGLILDWVEGRNPKPLLQWHDSAQESRLTLKDESVAARTDGSLQITVRDPQTGDRMFWARHYYVVPLEAKRFYREEKNKEKEITNNQSMVFAGQVFAEMLGGICHPEFYRYVDQEAFAIFIQHTSFQLYHCEFPQEYLRTVHDDGIVDEPAHVILKVTRPYNFCDRMQRSEWFDVMVALFQYLQSGESKAGFLNKQHPKNMLHKDIEIEVEAKEEEGIDEIQTEAKLKEDQVDPSAIVYPVQRSSRKRASDKRTESGRRAKRRQCEQPGTY